MGKKIVWHAYCHCLLRTFVSICTKVYVYFSIRTYFFYFAYSLFKTFYIRLSILHYISLKYQPFLIFKIVSLYSHTLRKNKQLNAK